MIAFVILVGVIVAVWLSRRSKERTSTIAANQAAQQVQSPYAGLYARSPRNGLRGGIAERFLNRRGGF